MDDYYKILGVNHTVSKEEIRNAYRVLAKQLHPDRHPRSKRWKKYYTEMFIKVTEAYSVLSNPDSKKRYDAQLNKRRSGDDNDDFNVTSQKSAGDTSINYPEKLRDRIRILFENWAYETDGGTTKQKHNPACAEISKRIKAVKRKVQPAFNRVIELIYKDSD